MMLKSAQNAKLYTASTPAMILGNEGLGLGRSRLRPLNGNFVSWFLYQLHPFSGMFALSVFMAPGFTD